MRAITTPRQPKMMAVVLCHFDFTIVVAHVRSTETAMAFVEAMQLLTLVVFAGETDRVAWQNLALVGSASPAAREAALVSICTTCPTADLTKTCHLAFHARHVFATHNAFWSEACCLEVA